MKIRADEISEILKDQIKITTNVSVFLTPEPFCRLVMVSRIYGLRNAKAGEMLVPGGLKGMVLNLERQCRCRNFRFRP